MIELGPNRYGKSAIRLVRVDRSTRPHQIRDLTLDIALEGDFEAAHVEGDNASVVATDTMKNTAYAFGRDHLTGSIDEFGRALAEHFVAERQVSAATVSIREASWNAHGSSPDAFVRDASRIRTAIVRATAGAVTHEAGVSELVVMKTTRSAFSGFPRDRYTTLPETDDRLMATKVSARWRYGQADIAGLDFDAVHRSVVQTLLDVFADHDSRSVQHSIWLMGQAILERHAAVAEVSMTLPNLHHWLVDLSPFGLDNPAAIYVATTEPHGLIEATIRRGQAAPQP